MAFKRHVKDPDNTLDYPVNWCASDGVTNDGSNGDDGWLQGDTIAGLTIVADAGITVDSSSYTDTHTVAVLSGGTLGKSYTVTFRITTTAGLIKDHSIIIKVKST